MSDPAQPGDLQPQGDPAIATNFEGDPSTGAVHQGLGEALLSTGVVMSDGSIVGAPEGTPHIPDEDAQLAAKTPAALRDPVHNESLITSEADMTSHPGGPHTGVVMGDAHYAEDNWQNYQQDVDEPQIPTE
ncbi:MAG TPA: hypothetical protein VE074_15570 [Jatrophihabitantaceae bacterium]|nr:hypothetical protein [Jatrophihabitantaceae bacterium]